MQFAFLIFGKFWSSVSVDCYNWSCRDHRVSFFYKLCKDKGKTRTDDHPSNDIWGCPGLRREQADNDDNYRSCGDPVNQDNWRNKAGLCPYPDISAGERNNQFLPICLARPDPGWQLVDLTTLLTRKNNSCSNYVLRAHWIRDNKTL